MISIKEVCARRKEGLLYLGLETQRELEKEMSVATRKAGRATHVYFILQHSFVFKILTKGRDYLLNAPSEQKRVSLLKSQQYVMLVYTAFVFIF